MILDGRGGGTGAAALIFRNNISVPTIPALARARRHLDRSDRSDRSDVTLIITGGLRVAKDFVKAMALRAVTTLVLLALTCQSLRGDRFDSVSVRTWDTVKDAESFPPELKDDALKVPWLLDRPSFGIAFSGGGSRAATATLGQLRALRALGWLDPARHISANSGSTWTAVPFTYLPAQADEGRFLGPYVPPELIGSATLAPAQEDPQAMATALHSATLIKRLGSLVHGDEAYADLVGSIYLKPFGLHNKKRVFTFHRAALQTVLDNNPDLREQGVLVIDLDRERVNALSNLTAWALLESGSTIRRGLPTARLPSTSSP